MHQQQTDFENIVEKEEIACYKQFLLFPQCFLLDQIIVPHLSIFLKSYLYLLLNWKSPKLACEVKGYGEQLHQSTLKSINKYGSYGLDKYRRTHTCMHAPTEVPL